MKIKNYFFSSTRLDTDSILLLFVLLLVFFFFQSFLFRFYYIDHLFQRGRVQHLHFLVVFQHHQFDVFLARLHHFQQRSNGQFYGTLFSADGFISVVVLQTKTI